MKQTFLQRDHNVIIDRKKWTVKFMKTKQKYSSTIYSTKSYFNYQTLNDLSSIIIIII